MEDEEFVLVKPPVCPKCRQFFDEPAPSVPDTRWEDLAPVAEEIVEQLHRMVNNVDQDDLPLTWAKTDVDRPNVLIVRHIPTGTWFEAEFRLVKID